MNNEKDAAIYAKCMSLAKDYAANKWASMNTKTPMRINNPWVNLWKAYSKGEIDENETKACFLLGYLSAYAEQVCEKYSIRETKIRFA